MAGVDVRRTGIIALVLAVLVPLSTPHVSAGEGSLTGDIPAGGGVGLVVFTGGTMDDLDAAAAREGCALTSAFVPKRHGFAGYIVGAPAFVNHDFTTMFPAGVRAGTPLIVVCADSVNDDAVAFKPLYMVRAGDSVVSIAKRFGVTAAAILETNSVVAERGISIGDELRIPAGDSTTVIGTSIRGRPIEVACVGSGARMVLVVGAVHVGPFESITSRLALEVTASVWAGELDVPQGIRLCVLPTLNVDGLALGTRTNARGVDLNRNWPAANWIGEAYHPEDGDVSGGRAPLSEPETRALYDYIVGERPVLVVAWHCCGGVVEGNSWAKGPA